MILKEAKLPFRVPNCSVLR